MIWSQIIQLFHRNDHHIETTCRVQYLGCYLEGQGHSMTLHQNRVWPKTLLFEDRFYNYFWQTTSLCPIPIRGALPGSDRLLFLMLMPKLCSGASKPSMNTCHMWNCALGYFDYIQNGWTEVLHWSISILEMCIMCLQKHHC